MKTKKKSFTLRVHIEVTALMEVESWHKRKKPNRQLVNQIKEFLSAKHVRVRTTSVEAV